MDGESPVMGWSGLGEGEPSLSFCRFELGDNIGDGDFGDSSVGSSRVENK